MLFYFGFRKDQFVFWILFWLGAPISPKVSWLLITAHRVTTCRCWMNNNKIIWIILQQTRHLSTKVKSIELHKVILFQKHTLETPWNVILSKVHELPRRCSLIKSLSVLEFSLSPYSLATEHWILKTLLTFTAPPPYIFGGKYTIV